MTRLFAHRGSSRRYPENTRASYLQAIADGADGIECDIHLTADHQLVCHHDAVLGRTERAKGEIRSMTLAQLRRIDMVSWKRGRWPFLRTRIPGKFGRVDQQLCTLAELVEIAANAGRPIELAIETKHQLGHDPRLEAAMTNQLEALGFDRATLSSGNVTVSFMSFEPAAVQHLSAEWGPERVCQLLENKRRGWEGDVLRGLGTMEDTRYAQQFTGGVANIEDGTAGIVGPGIKFVRAHEAEFLRWLETHTARIWTVDKPADAAYLEGLGVQEMTSNVPAEIRESLGR
ncbi:MAG: glycerophosphodiester phosphodiesterase [Galactobacter sp.]